MSVMPASASPTSRTFPISVAIATVDPPTGRPLLRLVGLASITVSFLGPAFSDGQLIGLAYAFEQATHHRRPPASTPPLPGDSVARP